MTCFNTHFTMLRPTCVRSAVLGGQVVSEVKGSGVAERGYLYLGAARLARIGASGGVKFEHRDPASTSIRKSDSTGSQTSRVELDPLGVQTGLSGSEVLPPPVADPFAGEHYGNAANPDSGCYVDGVSVPCGLAIGLLQSGAGVGAPGALSGWRRNPQTGRDEWLVFRAFADGYAGYVAFGKQQGYGTITLIDEDGTRRGQYAWEERPGFGGFLSLLAPAGQLGRGAVKVNYLPNDGRQYDPDKWNPAIEGILYGFLKDQACIDAYQALGIDLKALLANGLAIGPSNLLINKGFTSAELGLTDEIREKGTKFVDSTTFPAYTIPSRYSNVTFGGEPFTTDGKPRIFLNPAAIKSYNYLKETLSHELIHAGGYAGKAVPWYKPWGQDLDYLGSKFDEVQSKCGGVD